MSKTFNDTWYGGGQLATWFKVFYEYGVIGSFVFVCFWASCLRRSRCPGLVIAVIIFTQLFLQGTLIITIPLCTLNVPERSRRRIDEASRYGPSLAAGSATG